MIEDLHWADAALLEFVEHLLDWAADVPLMVVATARPELYDTRPGWGGGRRNSTTLGLSPLSDEDTARLVSSLLERSVMPAETQAALLERAGGNPLYAEQFVRMLVEAGASSEGELPETVQALIAARLDTLAPGLKSMLQDASVLGKVFWTGALAAMGGRARGDVLSGVRELVRREFVRPARVSSMQGEEELSSGTSSSATSPTSRSRAPREARSTSRRPSGSKASAAGSVSPTTRTSSSIITRRRRPGTSHGGRSAAVPSPERRLAHYLDSRGRPGHAPGYAGRGSVVSACPRVSRPAVRPRRSCW